MKLCKDLGIGSILWKWNLFPYSPLPYTVFVVSMKHYKAAGLSSGTRTQLRTVLTCGLNFSAQKISDEKGSIY